MPANTTCIAEKARLSIAAAIVFSVALLASPFAWSQNAVNTATVAAPANVTDPNTANNTATDSDPIVRNANLSLSKAANPSAAIVGQVLTYTLSVSNAGPSAILAANTFSIVESLPAGLTGCSYTPSAGTFTVGTIAPGATGTGTWTGVAIPSGGSATLAIACTVGAAAAASITNTATVIPPTGVNDPDCSGSPVACGGGNTGTVTTPVNRPQLTMTKTASTANFVVGTAASYTLQVSNTGTAATSAAATVSDTIPTGLTIGTLPAGCTAAGQTVTCTVAAGLAAGASTSFVIPVTPTLAAGTSVTNTATVSGGGDPTCPANVRCTSTVTTPVNAPQLTITKTASAASFTVGTAASYTLSVQNTGTTATTAAATITDAIPTGLTIGTLPAGCTAAGQTVTCTIAAGLAAGATTSFVIPVTATTAAAATVTNTATVSGGGDATCPADARCTSTVTTPVNRPQLTMTKTASTANFIVGTAASYTLQVSNTGTAATSAAATVTDTIPTGLTIGTLPAGCTAAGQTVTCTVAAGLAAGASTSFVIPVTPTLAAGTSVTNTATVSGGGDPTCPANVRCTSTVTTPVNAPQLTLTKTASAASFTVGTAASYTLSVQNTGTTATTAASTITDAIPTGLTIGTLPAGCTAAGQTVTCTIAAGLAAGATTSFVIPVTATVNAAATLTNTATVSGGGDATCPANARCTSTVTTPVNRPQLTMTKTASTANFVVGTAASYTLQVSNTGTAATSAAATVTDTIPTGLTIGTLPAGCTAAGQTVTCTVAAGLAAGASTSFVIPVTPTLAAGTTVTNTATVSGGGDPTCPANARCTSTVTTPVNAPQLTITKTASAASFTVGTAASYTLSVQNTGTTATTAASTITDAIPTGLTIGTLPAGCTAAGQTVTCTIAAGLAAGATTSFVIPVTATTAAAATVTNTATVSGGGDATCPANARCTSTVTTPVNRVQLTMTKTASAAEFTVGTPASYTLSVQNTGTAATTAAASVTDTIPTGLTIGTLPAGCTAAGQTVTCTIAAGLAAGASTSFVIPVTPTASAGTSVTNTARVSGGGDAGCPVALRCTSTVTTPVNGAQLTITKSASAPTFVIGIAASYTLSVQNTGSSATTAVATVTDAIPAGLTIGTLPAGCTAAGQTVTCTIAAGLAVNATATFTIPVTPTVATAASITNTATVSGGGDPGCPAAARCASTVTTTVIAAPIDAVNDSGTVPSGATGGVAVPNVLVNDTLNGAPATLATVTLAQVSTTNPNVTLDPATGAVNVAPGTPAGTYTLVYRICEILNPTNCDNATVTVTVNAAVIDAVDDSFGPIVGASGGTTPSVIVNDTIGGNPAVIGTTVTLAPGTSPNPGLTMNPNGTITVAAGTPAGTYLYPYTICEILNPTNCDTATATVVVAAAPIDAVNDSGTVPSGAAGGVAVPNVLVNDTLNGAPATLATVTLAQVSTSNPNVTLDPATGAVNVAPGTPAGTYTLVYRICEILNPTNCDTATVTVTVNAAVIDAVDDSFGPIVGASGGTTPSVIVNDTIGGNPAVIGTTVTLAPGTSPNPGLVMNPNGTITVAAGTPAGTYLYPYTICEILNPTNCDTATATVVVAAAPIDAVNDSGTVPSGAAGGVAVPNVLVNDTLNGAPATLATVTLAQVSTTNPNVTLDPATGAVNVAPGTPAGTYTLVYRICEILNPTNCDNATVTVTVNAAVIDAVDDSFGPIVGASGGTTPSVIVNDTIGGNPAVIGTTVTLAPGTSPNPGLTMNPNGTITVAAGTPAGTYLYPYTICEILNPANCDTATATVEVTAAAIVATDDGFGPVGGAAGNPSVGNAYGNDTLNGVAVDPADITGTVVTPATPINGGPVPVLDTATGNVSVPAGTPAGTYTITYRICETLNPTNCDTATITVTVDAAAIVATDDGFGPVGGAAGNPSVGNAYGNDTLNGVAVDPADITGTVVTPATPINGGPVPVLDTATGNVSVPAGTPAGTYTIAYRICETLNPTNCDTATITVTVDAAAIVATDDGFGPVGGAAGNPSVGNAYGNDTLNGVAVDPADITGTVVTPATPINGGPVPVLDTATGNVSVPAGTPAGTYTIAYRICETLNPTNCDTATITVTVDAAAIDAVDDGFAPVPGVIGGTTPSVLVNDTLNGAPVDPASVTLTPGAAPVPATGGITMNPDGTITIAPGTTAGTYPYPYSICEVLNPANCDTAIATVIVAAEPGLAIDKSAGTPTGSAAGATVPYTFLVTNTGNVPVTGLVINDAQLDAPATCLATTLAAGASTTCTGMHTITQAEVDAGVVLNTATATGTLPGGGTAVSPPDSTSTPIVQAPAITATKTATLSTDGGIPGLADVGDVITYSVSVRNTGNVTLSNLVMSDSFEGGAPTTLTCTPTTLAPGATATCALYTHTVTAAEAAAGGTLDNVATATATSSTSTQTVTSTSTAVVAVNGEPAAIRITKTASPRDVKVGDLVRYTLVLENTSLTPMTDGTLIDTPPAGFTYVDGSLSVADADNAGRLVGTYPIRVDQLDIAGEGRATITYLLRVGAGVRPGVHTNRAYVEDDGAVVSNVATADVRMAADPLLDESLILGTVFNDRDSDGWQDAAGLGGVRVQGGFAPDAYVAGSTTLDRGEGPAPVADASAPLLHGIAVGDIAGRQSEADPAARHAVVIRQTLRELRFTDDFVLTSAQGVTVRMAADGSTRVEKGGDAAKGLNAAEPTVSRRVSQVADGYVVDYVIGNDGIDERGIPGVRIASVEGLLMETDQYGRYHLVGVEAGQERGRNVILKVDPATLPPGSTFTTANPLVKRVTPGLPTRFDFGVKLAIVLLDGGQQTVEMELGSVMFAPGKADIREEYRAAIDRMAATAQQYGRGEVVIQADAESEALAFARGEALRKALVAKLSPEAAAATTVSVRTGVGDPASTLVTLSETPVLGTVLFDTDSARIKPRYLPLIAEIARSLQARGVTQVGVVGHADKRGGADYNVALGMRRAKAVYEALAEALPPALRGTLRVDFNDDPAAPAGMNGQ